MPGYVEDNTQEGRILSLLKSRGKLGVMVYEFMMPRPQGLGIAQYSARIWGLRKKGYIITNKKPGMFVLDTPNDTDWEKIRKETVDKMNEPEKSDTIINSEQPTLL